MVRNRVKRRLRAAIAGVKPNLPVVESGKLVPWRDLESLSRALRSLPAEQRRVIVLAYFAGMSQAELADYLGIPLGTVKKRIQLGMRKIRAALAAPGLGLELPESPLLAEPPFAAVLVQAAVTQTLGGLRVDEGARVLREDATPVAGLYAAGADVGRIASGGWSSGLAAALWIPLFSCAAIAARRPGDLTVSPHRQSRTRPSEQVRRSHEGRTAGSDEGDERGHGRGEEGRGSGQGHGDGHGGDGR